MVSQKENKQSTFRHPQGKNPEMCGTKMILHQVSVLLSYRLPFIWAWPNPSISSHMGCSSVLCLWEEEQGGSIFYKYSGFLRAGLDWAGWASHAGTSQPGGWGVTVEWREKEWRHRALPMTLEPVSTLKLQSLSVPPCASEWVDQFHNWIVTAPERKQWTQSIPTTTDNLLWFVNFNSL